MDQDSQALKLYEKITGWKEFQPEDLQVNFDVFITRNRIEVVNKKIGALEIDVEGSDQFSVREPRKELKTVGESEMLAAVKQWFDFPSYPPSGSDR
jgi:hypothetical protein